MTGLFPPFSDDDTSLAAAESIEPQTGTIRQQVLAFVKEQGATGATCDEVIVGLGLPGNTVRPRLWELRILGLASDWNNGKRLTRSGRKARIWRADS